MIADLPLALALLGALLLDRALGEPQKFHPLVGFGAFVRKLERMLYRDNIAIGTFALCLALLPALLTLPLYAFDWHNWLLVPVVYLAIGRQSLREHAEAVASALEQGDLALARQRTGFIVSRNTDALDAAALKRATIESVLENGNDTLFGALFWAVIAGIPGVLLYRLSNTLDAMWGYRNARYQRFGKAAARLDDVLNYLPARLTALSYALIGRTRPALHAWRTEANKLASPNGGPVMSAGAGALNLKLGGPACYSGQWVEKPWFGGQNPPKIVDINAACQLVERAGWLWLAVLAFGQILVLLMNR